jgi:hypothetical protein
MQQCRFGRAGHGYAIDMHVFTRRNALVGWIVTVIARRKAKRRFRAVLAQTSRHRLAFGASAVATGLAVTAVAARRSHADDARPF